MAGDSETKPGDQAENESNNRQPFLIGVAGGTASGKVGVYFILFHSWYLLGIFYIRLTQQGWYNWGYLKMTSKKKIFRVKKNNHRQFIMFVLDQLDWLCGLINNERDVGRMSNYHKNSTYLLSIICLLFGWLIKQCDRWQLKALIWSHTCTFLNFRRIWRMSRATGKVRFHFISINCVGSYAYKLMEIRDIKKKKTLKDPDSYINPKSLHN